MCSKNKIPYKTCIYLWEFLYFLYTYDDKFPLFLLPLYFYNLSENYKTFELVRLLSRSIGLCVCVCDKMPEYIFTHINLCFEYISLCAFGDYNFHRRTSTTTHQVYCRSFLVHTFSLYTHTHMSYVYLSFMFIMYLHTYIYNHIYKYIYRNTCQCIYLLPEA